MKMQYPHMFSPITIGGVTFKNRIWSAPAGAHLLQVVACREMARLHLTKLRHLMGTPLRCKLAASTEPTALGGTGHGCLALNGFRRPFPLQLRVGNGNGRNQRLSIGVQRLCIQCLGGCGFPHLSLIHI